MDLPFKPEFAHTPEGASKEGRTPILPLLTGYWSFGQYWGVWVILVFEFQKAHHISNPRLGLLYTLLSSTNHRRHAADRPAHAAILPVDERPAVPDRLGHRHGRHHVPAEHVHVPGVRRRRRRQRIDRHLRQRGRATGRGPNPQTGPAVAPCRLRVGRGHGRGSGGAPSGGRCRLQVGACLRERDTLRNRFVGRANDGSGTRPADDCDHLLHLRALPFADALDPRDRGVVRVPDRGIDGHVVRPLPAARTARGRGDGSACVHGVQRGRLLR